MKERPILFSGPMVRAILEGRKTQTRRVVKFPEGTPINDLTLTRYQDGYPDGIRPVFGTPDEPNALSVKCPYACSRLWVREEWKTGKTLDKDSPKAIEQMANECGYTSGVRCPLFYTADKTVVKWGSVDTQDFGEWGKGRRSFHMPRWASRINLTIKRVWVERLQDIGPQDATAEGIDIKDGMVPATTRHGYRSAEVRAFADLWDSINGEPRKNGIDISWAANPWVWCVEFEVEK